MARSSHAHRAAPSGRWQWHNRTQVQHDEPSSIYGHIELIQGQVAASLRDPEVRALAGRLVSGRFDVQYDYRTKTDRLVVGAWGRLWDVGADPDQVWGPCPKKPGYNAPDKTSIPDSEVCEIARIWTFYNQNVRYVGDIEGIDVYQDVQTTLAIGAADCDDAAIWFGAMLRAIGYQVYADIIDTDGKGWSHIYPVVLVPKMHPSYRLPLDPTEDLGIGWEHPSPRQKLTIEL